MGDQGRWQGGELSTTCSRTLPLQRSCEGRGWCILRARGQRWTSRLGGYIRPPTAAHSRGNGTTHALSGTTGASAQELCSWVSVCGQTGSCWQYSQGDRSIPAAPTDEKAPGHPDNGPHSHERPWKRRVVLAPPPACVSQRTIWCLFPLFLGDYLKSTMIIIFKTN